MAKLILSMDGLVLKEIPLTKERTTIGRKPHNDIQIDNLAVSGEHAVIVTILNDSFMEDLGSTNGTLVNGNTVKKHFLQNNDVVELGKYKLKYIAEPGAAQPAEKADFEKTMVLRPSAMRAAAEQAKAMAAGGAQPQAAEAARVAALQAVGTAAQASGIAEKPAGAPPAAPHAAPAAPAVPRAKRLSYKDQREFDTLPATIELLEADKARLDALVGDPAFYSRPATDVRDTLARVQSLAAEVEGAYARWAALEALRAG